MSTQELPVDALTEWLETDGLGGFASGTSSGLRTRRYHALLLAAAAPPADRRVLVQGFVARLETPEGSAEFWPQAYAGGSSGATAYVPHYQGGVWERDGAYHQGTVWPWLIGPFVEAWVKVRGNTNEAKLLARQRFLAPLYEHLSRAGLGHVSEIADADAPHAPRGCPFQAWSVAELLRLERVVLAPTASVAEKGQPLLAAS